MTAFKIKSIKAFIATEEDGTEGIIAAKKGDMFFPFVCADDDRVESLRSMALAIAKKNGDKVTLAKFSLREDIEVLNADGNEDLKKKNLI